MAQTCMLHSAASTSMATSSGSAADDTPGSSMSEDADSVLDFAHRQGFGGRPQFDCPRSSKRTLKRRRDACDQQLADRLEQPACQPQPTGNISLHMRSAAASQPVAAVACQKPDSTSYYLAVYTCLMQWCYRLKALQPKCIITKDVLHRSLDLFHRYRQTFKLADEQGQGPARLSAVHLAACLWIASKSDGNRACIPSRTLLTRAVAVCPEELSQAELIICCKLKWNILNFQVAVPSQL